MWEQGMDTAGRIRTTESRTAALAYPIAHPRDDPFQLVRSPRSLSEPHHSLSGGARRGPNDGQPLSHRPSAEVVA